MADTTKIGDIAKQMTKASRVIVSTDGFWVQTGDGQSVQVPAEFVRAYLGADLKPTINEDGYWQIGDTTTTIVAEGKDGKDGYPEIVEQTEGIVAIEAGVLNVWTTSISTLAVTFKEPKDKTLANEYMMRFTTGLQPQVTLPSTVKWNVNPSWEPNTTYEISVINNYGVIAGWKEQ